MRVPGGAGESRGGRVTWDRSPEYEQWPGCRYCLHWRAGRCAAYPERIPLPILSGDVNHLVPRPGQVGEIVFEQIDLDRWERTGERVPDRQPTAAPRRRTIRPGV